MKNSSKALLTILFTVMLVLPNTAHAFVPLLIPAISAESAAITETVTAGAATAIAIRNAAKEGSRQLAKQGAVYLTKKVLTESLKLSRQQLKELKQAKIIWSPNTKPKKGKQLLYYISLEHLGEKYYKIGISTQSLKKRYPREFYSAHIKPIIMLELPVRSAYVLEQAIAATFYADRASNRAILRKDKGYTEVFNKDVLGLDNYKMSFLHLFL